MNTKTETYPAKFRSEELDYQYNWALRLTEGESIVSVTATGVGLTAPADRVSTDGAVTTWWVTGDEGLRDSTVTRVNLLATTDAGRKMGLKAIIPIES